MNQTPAWLEWWLTSGHAIDLILGSVVLEFVVLAVWLRATAATWSWAEIISPILAGIFLMLALRNVLVGGQAQLTALWLALSGPSHAFDLWRRVQQRRRAS